MPPRKTDRMFLGRPPEPAASARRRNTDLMGLPADEPPFRDTVKDSRSPFEEALPGAHDAAAAAPPRGDAAPDARAPSLDVAAKSPQLAEALGELRDTTPMPRGGTMPLSARIESLEAPVPNVKLPAPVGAKVDLSRADPRRAPTQRVARRPPEALEPDWSVAHRAPSAAAAPPPLEGRLFRVALALLATLALTLVGLVVYLKVLR